MDKRIYGVETEYALSVETSDRRLRPIDPGMLFEHLETALKARFESLEGDSFGRDPGSSDGDGIGIREGRFLENGARFYYDTGHLEWATPEAASARGAVVCELAGEHTLVELARGLQMPAGTRLMLIKNNVDYVQGRTFGCHENYLVTRGRGAAADRRFFGRLVDQLVPFLVTRQIFAGAGKVGAADPAAGIGFQLSQRADFITRVTSDETRSDRAIINLRDESLGDEQRYRRLHLILGDSNRSPVANLLKLGTTGIVLRLIESGALAGVPELADPVAAIQAVSRDSTCGRPLPLAAGGERGPIAVQRHYLDAANAYFSSRPGDAETDRVLALWGEVLDDLEHAEREPERVADRVDWAIKRHHLLDPLLARAGTDWDRVGAWGRLLAALEGEGMPGGRPSSEQVARWQFEVEENGLSWEEVPAQQRLYFQLRERDLRYHDIDPERGLYALLAGEGLVRVDEVAPTEEIREAQSRPPGDTRARLRTEVIHWAHKTGHENQTLLDWGRVALPSPRGMLALDDPFRAEAPELESFLTGRPAPAAAAAVEESGEIPIRILEVSDVPRPPRAASGGAVGGTETGSGSWLRRLLSG